MIKLVAFLGNYGAEYEKNRHNAAWIFASQLPFYEKLVWQKKFKGEYAVAETSLLAEWFSETKIHAKKDGSAPIVPDGASDKIYFLKPYTYMNLSGESLGEISQFFKILPEQILVVHDELELPLGTVSLKWSGGLGGHNGLRSIKSVFGTADFWRLRIGLTKPADKNIADYVLSNFTEDEQIVLAQEFSSVNTLLAKIILSNDEGLQKLLQGWSKKHLADL